MSEVSQLQIDLKELNHKKRELLTKRKDAKRFLNDVKRHERDLE
jgi:hypothetical protein